MTKIVSISDTHEAESTIQVPDGDILIHAGDFTNLGNFWAIRDFNNWLGKQPHPIKIVIAGNHDLTFQHKPGIAKKLLTNAIYLENESVEIGGLRFWGSPVTPYFFNWAFMYDDKQREILWKTIPDDTDIVITHGPPHTILDMNAWKEHQGCGYLLARMYEIKPKAHFFGHLHESYGTFKSTFGTTFVNCSIMNENYEPVNKPITINC